MRTLQSELPSSFQRPAAEDLAICRHCQADIVRDALDQWCDAGIDTAGKVAGSLVFCHDQDENPDYQRHEPTCTNANHGRFLAAGIPCDCITR